MMEKKKKPGRFSLLLLPLLFTVIFLMGCGKQKAQQPGNTEREYFKNIDQVVGIGRVEPELKLLALAAEVPGIVTEIKARPGDNMLKGQTVVIMNNDVDKARVEISVARVQVQQSQVQAAKSRLAALKIQEQQVSKDFKRAQILLQKEATSQVAYEELKTRRNAVGKEIQQLAAQAKAANRMLEQLKAELKLAEAQLRQKTIVAPVDGQLLSMDITIGSFIQPGSSIGRFAPSSARTVWCEIDELFADRVRKGLRVHIRHPGNLEILGEGKVIFVGPWLRKKSIFSDDVGQLEDRRIREVRVLLDSDVKLLLGARVECVILLNRFKD